MAVNLEGFSNFLLIVIAPFLLISQLIILSSKEAIHRNNLEEIVRLYTWTFVYPFTYLCIIFSIYVTARHPIIGTILLVVFILGTLYLVNALKSDSHAFTRAYWYQMLGLLAVLYILAPLYIGDK
jgi:uncharacterized membrane protein YdfJ with MMPL/SSD domain